MIMSVLRSVRQTAIATLAAITLPASADWYSGKVLDLGLYYGTTVVFRLVGNVRTNCTCTAGWPNHLCLDRTRVTHKEELASLMLARAQDKAVQVNIDEATCTVLAMLVQ
jgi:hypothetical protein